MSGYLITGAGLVDGDGERPGSLRTDGERIAEVLPADLPDADLADLAARHGCAVVDGRGRWLVPGGVDPHVHFALPVGDTVTVDDFATGTRAALAGGTTTIIDFVTPRRDESLLEATAARLVEAARSSCDYALHASATAWRSTTAAELRACVDRFGLRSLKLYLAYLETIGLEDADLFAAMQAAAALDLTVLLHCEDGASVSQRQRALLAAGETGPAAHPRSRPPACEVDAVVRALDLAARAGCRPYVVHASTGGAVAAIRAARTRGQMVRAETCPQYLLLDEDAYQRPVAEAALFVMSPPLRSPAERDALRAAVWRGDLDVVATDHCAFDRRQKERERGDFTRIPGGASGVEHRLALLYTLGVVPGALTPSAWVRLVSAQPARIFGLYPRKGSLAPGADADLVLWDPTAAGVIRAAADHEVCDHSVYEGLAVRGRAARVWLRGRTVVADGRLDAAPGQGRCVLV